MTDDRSALSRRRVIAAVGLATTVAGCAGSGGGDAATGSRSTSADGTGGSAEGGDSTDRTTADTGTATGQEGLTIALEHEQLRGFNLYIRSTDGPLPSGTTVNLNESGRGWETTKRLTVDETVPEGVRLYVAPPSESREVTLQRGEPDSTLLDYVRNADPHRLTVTVDTGARRAQRTVEASDLREPVLFDLDYTPSAGRITVTYTGDEPFLRDTTQQAGGDVTLQISSTGDSCTWGGADDPIDPGDTFTFTGPDGDGDVKTDFQRGDIVILRKQGRRLYEEYRVEVPPSPTAPPGPLDIGIEEADGQYYLSVVSTEGALKPGTRVEVESLEGNAVVDGSSEGTTDQRVGEGERLYLWVGGGGRVQFSTDRAAAEGHEVDLDDVSDHKVHVRVVGPDDEVGQVLTGDDFKLA